MIRAPLTFRTCLIAAGLALTAGCATPPPPPPPPPPPEPVAEQTPYRPLPPPQAAFNLQIPRKDATGVRQTVNTGLGAEETIWHFRSGWNVAALNCMRPGFEPITQGYAQLLEAQQPQLARANEALEQEFRDLAAEQRREEGLGRNREQARRLAVRLREAHSTTVYNYFASPPARSEFCIAALAVANEYLASPPEDFATFAMSGLGRFEMAFERFFTEYERYERESAEWDQRFGVLYGPSQPGWVAVHGNSEQRGAMGFGSMSGGAAAGAVIDPETGAAIPVVPVDEDATSQPVVQPIGGGQAVSAGEL